MIFDINISRYVVYAQQVKYDKKIDREEYLIKVTKQRQGKDDRSLFQMKSSNYGLTLINTPSQKGWQNHKAQGSQMQKSVAQGLKENPPCGKCCRLHIRECQHGTNTCYKCGAIGHILKDCPIWRQNDEGIRPTLFLQGRKDEVITEVLMLGQAEEQIIVMDCRQDLKNSPNIMNGILRVFSFDVYALLNLGTTLSFVTPYLDNKFEILFESLLKSFNVSTPYK